MSLRGALSFAEAVSQRREIVSPRRHATLRRDPEKTSGQASKSPPRNDMSEQLQIKSSNYSADEAVSQRREIASSGPRKNIGAGEQEPSSQRHV